MKNKNTRKRLIRLILSCPRCLRLLTTDKLAEVVFYRKHGGLIYCEKCDAHT